jgi:hypothetical protein
MAQERLALLHGGGRDGPPTVQECFLDRQQLRATGPYHVRDEQQGSFPFRVGKLGT